MNVRYDCFCFERNLVVVLPDKYKAERDNIELLLDEAYDDWNNVESIEDEEERQYVQYACLEEYMVERLSEEYPEWIRWASKYYGDDPEEMEEEVEWIKNERMYV